MQFEFNRRGPIESAMKFSRITCWLIATLFLVCADARSEDGQPDVVEHRIVISKRTTHVTKFVHENGLPDYHAAFEDLVSETIPVDEDGTVAFWRAIWPGELSENEQAELCALLKIDPPAKTGFIDIHSLEVRDQVVDWLATKTDRDVDDPADEYALESEATDLICDTWLYPWKEAYCPPVANWLQRNNAHLDRIVEAIRLAKWSSPNPFVRDLGNWERGIVFDLEHQMHVRSVGRSLCARCLRRVDEHSLDQAWSDCHACLLLAAQVRKSPTETAQLVSSGIEGLAANCLLVLLSHGDLSKQQSARIQSALADLRIERNASLILDTTARWELLSLLIGMNLRPIDRKQNDFIALNLADLVTRPRDDVNFNKVLQRVNHWQNRFVAIGGIESARSRYLDEIALQDELEGVKVELEDAKSRLKKCRNATEREVFLGELAFGWFQDADRVYQYEDTQVCRHLLWETAVALARYRAIHGKYPLDLAALTPKFTSEIPADPYSSKPLVYEPRDDGFVLYSVYQNGVDDGGDDVSRAIVDGEWIDQPANFSDNGGNEDLVISLPIPKSRLVREGATQ